MIALLIPQPDDRLLGTLVFQASKEFKVYVPADSTAAQDYEGKFPVVQGTLESIQEPLVCVLEPGAAPGKDFVKKILRTARRHPEFDVYHVNLEGGKTFPRKASAAKVFKLTVVEGVSAPLSGFIFRTDKLRARAVLRKDGSLDPIPTVLSVAKDAPVRNVWRATLPWTAPEEGKGPAQEEARIREKLDLFRWSETYFGDENYPLSVGDQLDLFAAEVAKLYPSYSPENLKEIMMSFQVAQGTIRKVRASSALKSALKARGKQLD